MQTAVLLLPTPRSTWCQLQDLAAGGYLGLPTEHLKHAMTLSACWQVVYSGFERKQYYQGGVLAPVAYLTASSSCACALSAQKGFLALVRCHMCWPPFGQVVRVALACSVEWDGCCGSCSRPPLFEQSAQS